MAFLLCYVRDCIIDWRCKAIYLDQEFYETLCSLGETLDAGSVLNDVGSLKYGEDLLLTRSQLAELLDELERLEGSRLALHWQFGDLRTVVRTALDDGSEIAIAGDMHL